jgi:signal transduction histidine kinase
MPIDNIAVMLIDKHSNNYRPIAEIGNDTLGTWSFPLEVIGREDPLVARLSGGKGYLLKEDIMLLSVTAETKQIEGTFTRLKAKLCFPITVENNLAGILLVGAKRKGRDFHEEDIRKFKELIRSLEVHLAHSLFMEQRSVYSRKLSHDMRNLVGKSILPTLQMMESSGDAKDREEKKEALSRQVQLLDETINQFFDMNTIAGKIAYGTYETARVNLKEVIDEISPAFGPALERKKIALRLDCDGSIDTLGNRDDLKKAFCNLFDNAMKFTANGSITIKAENRGGKVLVEFEDTGIGIDKDKLEHIWEPFYSLDARHSSGLGLTIIKDIIEAHGGVIWAGPGESKGTKFSFILNEYRRGS